jgi:CSLREA domain-containing protein
MKEERMDTRKSFKSRFNKIAVNILSIFTVVTLGIMVIPPSATVSATDLPAAQPIVSVSSIRWMAPSLLNAEQDSATLRVPEEIPMIQAPMDATAAGNTDILVNTIDDELNSDGNCSLREAIQAANTDTPVDACSAGSGADNIHLPAGTYTLSLGSQLNLAGDVAIEGAGPSSTIVEAATSPGLASFRVLNIEYSDVVLSGLTIRNGNGFGTGGGIRNNSGTLALSSVAVVNNTAFNPGGGIYSQGSGSVLTLINSVVSGNTSSEGGGGGIVNESGTLTLANSVVSGNFTGASSGGISSSGSLVLENSTVSGNAADEYAGGIGIPFGATAVLRTSTVSNNQSDFGGGIRSTGTVELFNTIVAGNTAGSDGPDCLGSFTSIGYNLIGGVSSCVFTPVSSDLVGVDPVLGPLQDNGGPTQTHALLSGSPAIDAGSPDCPATDQRGQPRPVDGNGDGVAVCDIGAYEAEEALPPPPSPYLRAFPDQDFVDGSNWPANQQVQLAISDHLFETTAGGDGSVWFNLIGEHDLKRGEMLTMTSGDITVVYTVRTLLVTGIDPATQTVSGSVVIENPPTPETVHVFVGQEVNRYVDTDGSGNWTADFSSSPVLSPGVCGNAEAWGAGGGSTIVDWCVPLPPPSPWFKVYPQWENIEAWDWPLGTMVTATVDHPDTSESPDCSESASSAHPDWDPNAKVAQIQFQDCDIQAGDLVTVSGGLMTKEHTVTALEVTWFNVDENWVGGLATPGLTVELWVNGVETSNIFTSTDGAWGVDLDEVGYDLVPGTGGRATQVDDDGDRTEVGWSVPVPPNPRFTVFPEWEFFDGYDWPDGATVTITVEGKPECEVTKESWGGFFNGNFGEGCNIEVGDAVTFTDGATPRTHIVRNLAITSVDQTEDTVAGTADPGTVVNVWPHETGEQVAVTGDVNGAWQVDFTGAYDIVPGSAGRSEIRDEIGNGTAVDWSVPNPHFNVFPEQDALELWGWPNGATVQVSIDDPYVPGLPDFSNSYTIAADEGDPSFHYWINIPFDVGPNDVVTITDGVIGRTHRVRNLAIVSASAKDDTVIGTAEFPSTVVIWPYGFDQYQMEPTVGLNGSWIADFGVIGFNLEPGMSGQANIFDEVGNATAIDWYVPNPRVAVYLEGEFVIGWDWPHGAGVHLTIDDPTNGEGIDFEQDAIVGPTPFDPNTWWARLDFAGAYDVKLGDIVVLTDGITTREHVVLPLNVGEIDGEMDTVNGTSLAGANIYVHPWDASFDPVVADESGNWMMNFTDLYDLVPGTWGIAEVFDDANNSTAIDWTVLLPVRIDILPWNVSNLVPCRATGDLLPVAVFSTSSFDATAVDQDTIRFGRTGTEAEVVTVHGRPLRFARDVNRDGLVDMVYTFRFGDTGFSCADVPAGRHILTVQATLTGWTADIFMEGTDDLTLFRLLGH